MKRPDRGGRVRSEQIARFDVRTAYVIAGVVAIVVVSAVQTGWSLSHSRTPAISASHITSLFLQNVAYSVLGGVVGYALSRAIPRRPRFDEDLLWSVAAARPHFHLLMEAERQTEIVAGQCDSCRWGRVAATGRRLKRGLDRLCKRGLVERVNQNIYAVTAAGQAISEANKEKDTSSG